MALAYLLIKVSPGRERDTWCALELVRVLRTDAVAKLAFVYGPYDLVVTVTGGSVETVERSAFEIREGLGRAGLISDTLTMREYDLPISGADVKRLFKDDVGVVPEELGKLEDGKQVGFEVFENIVTQNRELGRKLLDKLLTEKKVD